MTGPTLVALTRYPLKSAGGEQLDLVDVERNGLRGDRTWACLDPEDGTIGSAKQPRRWGELLHVRARLGTDGNGVEVQVAGSSYTAGSPAADLALSRHLGHRVLLSNQPPSNPRLHRTLPEDAGMVPDWMADVRPGDETVTQVAGVERVGRFVDFGAVHLITTGELARLGQHAGSAAVAAARFRANLVIDSVADPTPGQELRIGGVVLRVILPTPRCVVPGLSHGNLPEDRRVLSALARRYRVPVPGRGKAACFGLYADVLQPGRIRLGQSVN